MKTIAIDFDGVIHKYSKGWQDGKIYDEPFENVFNHISKLMEENTVFIFSARSPRQIKKWMISHCVFDEYIDMGSYAEQHYTHLKYGFEVQLIPFWTKFWNKKNVLGITNRKLPAQVYIDDRALRFNGDWEETLKEL